MAATLAGPNNAYVASHESTQGLLVDFARNDDYPLFDYVQLCPVGKMVGYYAEMTVQDRMRITDDRQASDEWPDGTKSPEGTDHGEKHEYKLYSCKRRAMQDEVGDLAGEQASWDLKDQAYRTLAQKTRTKLTKRVLATALNTASWPTNHYSAVTSIPNVSSKWDVSTRARLSIKRSLNHAVKRIMLATGSAVKRKDLRLVIGAGLAELLAVTQEIEDVLARSPVAMARVQGIEGPEWRNQDFGLPDTLYGIKLIVEDTVYVSSARGATDARDFIMPATSAMLVSRPGGLIGVANAKNFSTLSVFAYNGANKSGNQSEEDPGEDMLAEEYYEEWNKRTLVRVTTNTDHKVTAGGAGFLFTGVSG